IALERPKDGQSLPFSVFGTGAVKGGSVSLDSSLSSQFLSALLLAAPRFQTGLTVRLTPATLPSRPHVDMTVGALRRFGATVRLEGHSAWRVEPGGLNGQDLTIEPDLSNAAPFLAAALVAGGSVRVPGWPATSDQPGGLLRDYLAAFGASVSYEEAAPSPPPASGTGQLTVKAEPGQIKGVDLDLSRAGELAPTLAALAALAVGPSRLGGIGHLKGHETDRLRALTSEINRLGGRARETADGLEIEPAPLHGALVRTYGDHRMATFGALIGLAVPGVSVEDVGVTAKTLPTFPQLWREMLGL
ncbi:MAG: 3-phosphoshikimate 1-carboxyvinyltransferase, partial [Bifidobacteriaceae bacterium]|nr:3-phosphoshikimate 1-carboxyvinyltransferase [Bifidobacteriaceae bacterium]